MLSAQLPPAKAPKRGVPWDDVPEARRAVMRAIKSKDTKPEMAVRRLVHGMGYRYRLHRKDLPGKPDLAFGPCRKVIFVHGCFWHHHGVDGCRGARMPATRPEYWRAKQERDERAIARLGQLGWRALTVWECQLRDMDKVTEQVLGFLGPRRTGQRRRLPFE